MEDSQPLSLFEKGFRKRFTLSDEEWNAFIEEGMLRTFTKGEVLFHAGDVADKLRFVCSGTFCNYYLTPDGTRRNKSFLQTGDVSASLTSFVASRPTRFTCEVLNEGICFEISASCLKQLSERSPGWKDAFLAMVTALAMKKEQREADLLLLSPTELYLQFVDGHPDLADSLPNYHIASYLGITEVSLSRIRAKLGMQNAYQRQ
ncbi:Crp/Fnr family transcriptional regulator [Enterovibrio sp. ZSDZ42]|uniref:Crp/Fnr family transcriptional regulator n=1 Tax=Enterovibrio gelatinilyticus TaxID=2899819 RepID=A0ABT5R7S7_9GAMM|nr:Crp/Fnr family transcriptional regulator [Enterovibrio sp. ZSDZ42]MDD1796328.1 Crp/Fnr family transcriptional regulator [Enterovibrio sp. ZSDZ42]